MVVGELVAMGDAKLVHPPHEPPGTTEQVELIPLAAVDVRRGTRMQLAIPGDECLQR
jgi:hypothetical protein